MVLEGLEVAECANGGQRINPHAEAGLPGFAWVVLPDEIVQGELLSARHCHCQEVTVLPGIGHGSPC